MRKSLFFFLRLFLLVVTPLPYFLLLFSTRTTHLFPSFRPLTYLLDHIKNQEKKKGSVGSSSSTVNSLFANLFPPNQRDSARVCFDFFHPVLYCNCQRCFRLLLCHIATVVEGGGG